MNNTVQLPPVKEILRQSWHSVSGSKGTFVWWSFYCVILWLALITLGHYFFPEQAQHHRPVTDLAKPAHSTLTWLIMFLEQFFLAPLMASSIMMGIKRARAQKISQKDCFRYYSKLFPIGITAVIISIISNAIGFGFGYIAVHYIHVNPVLFILILVCSMLITIVVQTLFSLSLPIVIEEACYPWEAIFRSCQRISPHFFKIIWLYILLFIMNIIGLALLGIGMIWTVPLAFITIGQIYQALTPQRP